MLTSVFGISIKYEAWNQQDSLPVYIAGSYDGYFNCLCDFTVHRHILLFSLPFVEIILYLSPLHVNA